MAYTFSTEQTLEFDTTFCDYPSAAKLNTNLFVVAARGDGNDGFVRTFAVTDDGGTISEMDELEFNIYNAYHCYVCRLSNTAFAIAYTTTSYAGKIATFSCDANGENIVLEDEDDLTTPGTHTSVCLIKTGYIAVAWSGTDDDGYVRTYSIDANIDLTQVDELEHDTLYCQYTDICRLEDTGFAIAYQGDGNDGYLKTFTVDSSADNITQKDSHEFDTTYADECHLTKCWDCESPLMLVYVNGDGDGIVKTFTVTTGNGWVITEEDSQTFESGTCDFPDVTYVDTDLYVICWQDGDGHGWVKVATVDASDDITLEDTAYEFEGSSIDMMSICTYNTTVVLVAYQGVDDDGFLEALSFEEAAAGWTGKIAGVTNPAKIAGIAVANIASVGGVE